MLIMLHRHSQSKKKAFAPVFIISAALGQQLRASATDGTCAKRLTDLVHCKILWGALAAKAVVPWKTAFRVLSGEI